MRTIKTYWGHFIVITILSVILISMIKIPMYAKFFSIIYGKEFEITEELKDTIWGVVVILSSFMLFCICHMQSFYGGAGE